MNIKNNIKRFIKSFWYAFKGIIFCLKAERNMRVHFCAAFYVIIFMRFYELNGCEKAMIYGTIGLVIALECVNTALESTVDLYSTEHSALAMIAKDTAAAAVLCAAVSSVAIGISIFWDVEVFKNIFMYFSENIFSLIALIVSMILWFLFIFSTKKISKSEIKPKRTINR